MSDLRLILILVSYLINILILASIPVRAKRIQQKTGNLIKKFSEKNISLQIVIIFSGLVLISILFLRDLGLIYNIVICLVGIFGIFMSSQEIVLHNKSGFYQNGIILNGIFLLFEEIFSIPVLNVEKSELKNVDLQQIKILRKKGPSVTFIFSSYDEGKEVLELLRKNIEN